MVISFADPSNGKRLAPMNITVVLFSDNPHALMNFNLMGNDGPFIHFCFAFENMDDI